MTDTIEDRAREYAHKNFADYLCGPVTAMLGTFARAELARAAYRIRAAALREAAEIIENNVEMFSGNIDGKKLIPRRGGDIAALTYAVHIRARAAEVENGDSSNGEPTK